MSFKRDETDPGPLGALQKRRVAELLANAIPEDEALLLRNGRFACSVCPHRPVCDTLEMLVVHRAGRKHLDSLQRSYGRKRSVQVTLQGPQVTLQGPQVTPQGPQVTPQGPQEDPGVAPGVQAPLLARTRRIAHSALLTAPPYSSRCRPARTKGNSSRPGNCGKIPKIPRKAPEPSQNLRNSQISIPELLPGHGEGDSKEGRKGNSQNSEGPSPERLRMLRHHLHLRSRGWLQDGCGNWVKDENAEFDSDEDEPPPPP